MYFNTKGPVNTAAAIELAIQEGLKRDISHIIAASNTGKTAEILAGEAKKAGYTGKLVCVTHVNGFRENGKNELTEENRARLEALGVQFYTASHLLSGAERAISNKFQGAYPVEIIAHTLRMLGAGMKVCVEIAVMALDGGLIPWGKPVIAIGGSGSGADTTVILSPAHGSAIFETRVHEILCKPTLV
ncbi:hypothetical protein AGMMS50255_5110 [Spirochaetia bacterium]|nr:hypothetical protein AGMMS50255_5110 [Spirochaetia bacterium]